MSFDNALVNKSIGNMKAEEKEGDTYDISE